MKRIIFWLLFITVAFFSCSQPESQTTTGQRMRVKTSPVVRRDMVDTVRIYGQVKLRQEAFLASQFEGRLAGFSLLPGDAVSGNEQVATIIPAEREALLQAMENVAAELKPLLEKQIQSIPLHCPMTGVVLDVNHHTGDVVQKGETIAHIGDLQILDVYGDLPVQYLALCQQKKRISVYFVAYPGVSLSLPVKSISGSVDVARQTVSVRLELENRANKFRPGMMVQLVFPDQIHNSALVIPRSALLEEEGICSAFMVHGSTVEKRTLETGILQDEWIEVLSGLQEGEQVVTHKAYSLTDGMEVVVE
jgi:RND family efflux transporter MFP subunit